MNVLKEIFGITKDVYHVAIHQQMDFAHVHNFINVINLYVTQDIILIMEGSTIHDYQIFNSLLVVN